MKKNDSNRQHKTSKDHHANQLNPNRGTSGENKAHKTGRDNRANQLNPNNKKTK